MIWISLAILIVSILINQLFLKRSLLSFRYYIEPDKLAAEIGEPIEVQSIVENHKQLPVSYVELVERYPEGIGGTEYRTSLYVRGFERVKRRHQIVAKQRGLYSLESGRMIVGDFLGFRREFRRYPLNKTWVVYPEKIKLADHVVPVDSSLGELSVKRWILPDPLMIRGVREYTGVEPQRSIHWPSSLRQSRLMVREYDFTADQSCLILLNVQTARPSWEKPKGDLIEQSIKLARALAEELEESSIPFGIRTNAYNYQDPGLRGYVVHEGLGEAHMAEVLDVLGRMDYKVGAGFPAMLRQVQTQAMSQVTVVIITPKLLDYYLEELIYLAKRVSRLVVFSQTSELLQELPGNIEVYQGVAHD